MGLQVHNHDRHVVSPNSLCSAGILANDLIEHLGSDLSWWYIVYSITYILHSFVIGETIPNSITTKNEELVSRVKRYSGTAKKQMCERQDDNCNRCVAWFSYCRMSGSAVIICSEGFNQGICLYLRPPMDLERFRFPFTLPNWLTKPPAWVIRLISRSWCGL